MTSAAGRELRTMAQATNYYRWMHTIATPYLGRRVVEIGGGIGSFSTLLRDRERLIILDNDPASVCCLHQRFADAAQIKVMHSDILDPAVPEVLGDEALDTAVSLNVLEHIADDDTALRHIHRALQPGGHLFLLVPALPQIYGTLDVHLEHVRRYERRALVAQLRRADFAVRYSTYFNSLGVAGWFIASRVRRQDRIGPLQVRLYDRFVVPLLSRAERVVPPPLGQSLIVVGQKASR